MIPARTPTARGTSLIETMIAMTIMSIGLLGMWQMHVIGLGSTASGRRHTVAMAVAEELASGIERLAYGDNLVKDTGSTSPTPPTTFGRLVNLSSIPSGVHTWNDTTHAVPGVRPDSELRTVSDVKYERRWSVWGYSPAAGSRSAVKLVAVSVIWRDNGYSAPREVVVYTQLNDQSTFASTLGANQ